MDIRKCRTQHFLFDWTRQEHPQQKHYALHAHGNYELLYILEGKGKYLVEGREYSIGKNCAMIMRPGEMHCLLIDEKVPYERICINFHPELFHSLDPGGLLLNAYDQRQLGEHNRYSVDCTEELRHFFADRSTPIGEERLVLSAQLFLQHCLFSIYIQSDWQHAKSGNKSPALEPVLRYINSHLEDELSLQEIADRFYFSPAQINRLMKRTVGTTFWNYVSVKRLIAARALLQKGFSAGAAAERCGFGEYSAFYRAYKKHFGVSPNDDRGTEAVISDD